MVFRLFLLFSIIPMVELAILIAIGTKIGALPTIALVLITATVGAILVRREGLGVIARFKGSLAQGVFPAEELIDGAMVLVSGALLLTPGLVTDVMGFLLVFPPSRQVIKQWVKRRIRMRISIGPGNPDNPGNWGSRGY